MFGWASGLEGYDLLFGHQNLIGSCGRMWEGGGVRVRSHTGGLVAGWVGGGLVVVYAGEWINRWVGGSMN